MLATSKHHLQSLLTRVLGLIQRYPRVLALFGFCSGLASFFLVDRQHRAGQVIAIIMLVSWLWLVLENLLTDKIAKRFGLYLPPALLRYVTQLIHQESLFFTLPFFAVTTAWNSGQAVFTGLLGVAALISITDPLYYKWLSNRRWLFLAYHNLSLFAVLLTVLPLILHLSTTQSYQLALATTVALSLPSRLVSLSQQTPWRWAVAVVLTGAIAFAGWLGRAWVPPATLWLQEMAITSQFDSRSRAPGDSLRSLTEQQLRDQGLYAYTAINAPRGLDERIYHQWIYNGKELDRIPLDIHGGREQGYRAWSRKQNFPKEVVGEWQVKVLTEDGQVIGTLRFEVQ
ncbi:DUF5924 family protein [Pokkaliibacter sp. MBI-7]|uniref:DUF5924 family protein n=1 Tax=Pokkaliibacter sp. MBI-7 TaxID=3040600 RepID=UPI00244B4474|nr:DUF5924 family protein [Pokkaliibacter sp. MBI-7]MDH2433197.1 DUF5924 family protein [Pokkaliibacter sp. MBI-7]